MIEVLATGHRCLVQDLGRPGLAHLGVGPSGALDPLALRRANALVGNTRGAACLEVLLDGLVLCSDRRRALAVTGSAGTETFWLDAGQTWRMPPAMGLVAYVAVRGGVAAVPVLGSRSTDTLGGLGPAPLQPGDVLAVGDDGGPAEPVPDLPAVVEEIVVRLLPGPRPELFTADPVAALCAASWSIGADLTRTAVRLDGPGLAAPPGDQPPEGLVTGAVQVPPGGRPVVFLVDRPVTGGYPVAGVVHPDDLRLLAQARPGRAVRFARRGQT